MLKREHKQVMSDLQKLPIEISEALNKFKQLIEENESYMSMPYHHPKPFSENLQMEYKQVMADLYLFENENTKALERFKELNKESLFYW
ncbi:putative disks large-like protein [Cricetulus griseus]|nr:putative disks large-like protein [Cricetulus griseus]